MKHKHRKKPHTLRRAPAGVLKVLRNPVHHQKAADAYGKSIEMQAKFLAAQRAINNKIQHDRFVSAGMNPSLFPSKIHG